MKLDDLLGILSGGVTDLLKQVEIKDWRWQRGAIGGPVDHASLKLLAAEAGLRADFSWFEGDDHGHRIIAEREFLGKVATVTLDGAPAPHSSVALAKHIHVWPPQLVVEIDVHIPNASLGAESVYKFTGHVR